MMVLLLFIWKQLLSDMPYICQQGIGSIVYISFSNTQNFVLILYYSEKAWACDLNGITQQGRLVNEYT